MVAVFDAFWRLGTADWKVDESLDGAFAWEAVRHGDWALADGHPILVRWLFGASQMVLGQNRVAIRTPGALAAVGAVALLYVVGTRLHSRSAGLIAAGIWAVAPRALVLGHVTVGPLRGDRFGYLEPFMVVALLGATLTGWNWIQRNRFRDAVATGLLVGVAVAFKPTAIVVVVPIVAMAVWTRRSIRPVLAGTAIIAVLSVAILPLSYLPLGTTGPQALRTLIDYQIDHAKTGHELVVDGHLIDRQGHATHLLYQWRGMGWAVCLGLLVGVVGAWTGRRRAPIVFVSAIWLTLLGLHLVSTVALPHYYVLWAPFSVLVAAMGLAELAQRTAPAPGQVDAGTWVRQLAVRWRRSPGPVAALGLAAVLLVGGGLANTWSTATLEPGMYAAMVDDLAAAGVHPAAVRYQGEAVDRYFPHAVTGQLGFTPADQPFDLLVLDDRDVPMLPAGVADEARAAAAGAGLTPHRLGRLELWYADPAGS